ncbi:hydantoinase/oxoprolinase N-terminal domain-containing protein [Mycolicibacterium houstonense]|uniref:hydantoinase/oxoprolinase N-terminal domain-containing protein n=1 Tax=Mycolicibacterium houstonense TaxID=146021 RepID=UPI00082C5F77|nr:hydantoinase/oxoprolinase N-terminal domain-containing protein [Mycolicibacterium houstonense]
MTSRPDKLRIGVDFVGSSAVALDSRNRIVAVCRRPQTSDSPVEFLDAVLQTVSGTAEIDRVILILPNLGIRESSLPGRVGVLRIGPPTTAVPPLAGWPVEPAAAAGPVWVVRGGHEYNGNVSEPLDAAAVTRFARACVGQVDSIALSGVNALENPAHEEFAANIISDELGPDIAVIRGSDTETVGLLERENTAVLDAALAGAARRRLYQFTALVEAHVRNAAVFVLRGDGTVMPATYAGYRTTASMGSRKAALINGSAHLAEVSSAVVVHVTAEGATVGTTIAGLIPDSGRLWEIDGIRTGIRAPRIAQISRNGGGFTERVHAAIARARWGHESLPVVVDGDRAVDVPDAASVTVIRPDRTEFAAAIGAAIAEAAGSVDRIFWQGAGGRQVSVARARGLAMDAAIRAGADPRTLRETPVREALMTYVPVPAARLQVTVIGPLMESAATAAVQAC